MPIPNPFAQPPCGDPSVLSPLFSPLQVKQPYTGRAKAAAVADDVPELD